MDARYFFSPTKAMNFGAANFNTQSPLPNIPTSQVSPDPWTPDQPAQAASAAVAAQPLPSTPATPPADPSNPAGNPDNTTFGGTVVRSTGQWGAAQDAGGPGPNRYANQPWRQNLATFAAGSFKPTNDWDPKMPSGLYFNPLNMDAFGSFYANPVGGGNAPTYGLPTSWLDAALADATQNPAGL